MDEVREFIKSRSITLTLEQIKEVVSLCNAYRISDFSSVQNRLKEVFASQKHGRRDQNRIRYFVTCYVCEQEYTADKAKFANHISHHFRCMDDNLVSFIKSFNQMVLDEAVKIARGDVSLTGSRLSSRGDQGVNKTLITSCIPTATIDLDISYALFIAETGLPLTVLNATSFHRLLNDLKAQKTRLQRHHVGSTSIPKCVRRMKQYITERLRGQTVCLVVDEMASFGIAYYNFIVCCRISKERGKDQPGVFFWDSRVLKNSTAESIGTTIASVADELMEHGIEVDSYVCDNCNSMKKSEVYAITRNGKQLKRRSCGSHALNDIFKDFLSLSQIKDVWENLSVANTIVCRRRLLSNELKTLQEQYPFEPIEYKPRWCCPYFDSNEIMTTTTLKDMNSTFIESMSSLNSLAGVCTVEDDSICEESSSDEFVYLSDEESDDCALAESQIVFTNESPAKRPAITQDTPQISNSKQYRSYRLRSFCPTRWYSAWLVMSRFYSLRHALRELGERMKLKKSLCSESVRTRYMNAINSIDDDDLLRVIHFLYPLVQGIDYCQRNDSMQLDIVPMIESIRSFYKKHSGDSENRVADRILDAKYEEIDPLFASRLSLFSVIPSDLRIIFFDELYNESDELTYDAEQLQGFIREACNRIVELVDKDEVLLARTNGGLKSRKPELVKEIRKYIMDKQYRRTVHDAMETGSSFYPTLFVLYKYFLNVPASAAVERSFSFQNALLTSSRNRLKETMVRDLLFLKMNMISATKFGWEDEMIKYLHSAKDE